MPLHSSDIYEEIFTNPYVYTHSNTPILSILILNIIAIINSVCSRYINTDNSLKQMFTKRIKIGLHIYT